VRRPEHVARIGDRRAACREIGDLEELGIDRRIILKLIFKK
jgi:hypothetical protein